jgi:hypothetical protein
LEWNARFSRFDLITGEPPPPPRTPGAVNIYTREYFQLIYDRLADGGITTYWLPKLYQSMLDPGRAKQAFASSSFIRDLWPGNVLEASQPYFEHQATSIGCSGRAAGRCSRSKFCSGC